MGRIKTWAARQATSWRFSDLVRPVSHLAGGTFIAQLVPVLVSPVLTRLYSPEAYGALAWAVSMVTLATLVASGTYEQAINLPPERETAAALVHGVTAAGLGMGLLLGIAALAEWQWRGSVAHRFWYVPLATALTVGFNALSAWSVREAQFAALAAARVTLALTGVAATLLLGYAGWAEAGLMTGNLVGVLAGAAVLTLGLQRTAWPAPAKAGWREIGRAASAYRRFPALLLPSSLLNTVANQLPIWFLQRLFGAAAVGNFALMNRVLNVPVALVSSSAGEVFKQRAAAEFRSTGRSAETWAAFAWPLVGVSVPLGILLLAGGPALFGWVFGEPWRGAGEFAQILALFFVLRCASSPLSYMLIVAQHQKLDLVLQAFCLGAGLLAWWTGAVTGLPALALAVFGGIYSLVYIAYFVVSHRLAHGRMPARS